MINYSNYSNTISDYLLRPPINNAVGVITGGRQITWEEGSTSDFIIPDYYEIHVSIDGGAYSLLGTVNAHTLLYNDFISEGTLLYKVRAKKGSNYSEFTSAASTSYTRTWSELMLQSYCDIISKANWTLTERGLVLTELEKQYVIDTFGAGGQNKSVCDFFMFFEVVAAYQAAHVAQTNTKSGATLRWDFGGGNIYTQNNFPAQNSTNVISLTSTDGFSGWTVLNFNGNGLCGCIPNLSYLCPNLTSISWYGGYGAGIVLSGDLSTWQFNNTTTLISLYNQANLYGDLVNMAVPDACSTFNIYGNKFTGTSPFIKATHEQTGTLTYNVSYNQFTKSGGTNFGRKTGTYNISYTHLDSTEITSMISRMNTFYSANAPLVNNAISVNSQTSNALSYNGTIIGGDANTDLINLKAVYVSAGRTATVTYNVDTYLLTPFTKPFLIITTDDVWASDLSEMYPMMRARGIVGTEYFYALEVGTGGHLTVDQLKTMITYGWDAQCHTYDHLVLTNPPTSEAAMRASFDNQNAWVTANGMAALHHLAYPSGSYDATGKLVAADYRLTARTTGTASAPGTRGGLVYKDSDKFVLPSVVFNEPLTQGEIDADKVLIDFAKNKNAGIIFYNHSASHASVLLISQLVDYAKEQGFDVLTISELYAKMI